MRKFSAVVFVVLIGWPAIVAGFILYALHHGWSIGRGLYAALWADEP